MAAWCYCVWELSVEDSVTGAWLLSSSKRLQIVTDPPFLYFIPLIFFSQFPLSLFFAPLDFIPLSIPSRSPSADSGSMCMMNWAGTPAAQALPRVHGDTTRGKLSRCALRRDTLLLFMHTWNSLHRCPHGLGSRTSASNMISQWFIHSIGALQDKYWFFSSEVGINALRHICRIVLAKVGQFANHPSLSVLIVFRNAFLMGLN